jgi:hypothetical protein
MHIAFMGTIMWRRRAFNPPVSEMFTTASRYKWQKTLAIALGGLGMATSPMAYGSGSEAQWDKALNDAWQSLSPKQKQELRQDERDWIQWHH